MVIWMDDFITHNVWYRAEIRHYSVADEYGDHAYISTKVHWSMHPVIRTTPKGVIVQDFNSERFIRGEGIKQFALPTKELALEDCIKRKERHISGCKARQRQAEEDLRVLQQYRRQEEPL